MNKESDFDIRIEGLKDVPEEVKNLLSELSSRLSEQNRKLSEQDKKLNEQGQILAEQNQKISDQAQKISDQGKLLSDQDKKLSEQSRRLLEKNSEIEEKKSQIYELEIEIANLKELLKLRTAVKFVPSSEILPSLFDEAEILALLSMRRNRRKKSRPTKEPSARNRPSAVFLRIRQSWSSITVRMHSRRLKGISMVW